MRPVIIFPIVLFVLMIFTPVKARSQILISLLLGDKLNTEELEFGLVTGVNRSYLSGIEGAEGMNNFNLGFYFHIKMLESSYLSTGVLVKSNVGAKGMRTYSTGDNAIDEVFAEGELTKKISYFYVPVLWQQRVKKQWLFEGGFQLGLRGKAEDIFEVERAGGETEFKTTVSKQYKWIDAGVLFGAGYKLKPTVKSMSVGVNYYHGFLDITKSDVEAVRNSSIYFYFKVPVGAGKSN